MARGRCFGLTYDELRYILDLQDVYGRISGRDIPGAEGEGDQEIRGVPDEETGAGGLGKDERAGMISTFSGDIFTWFGENAVILTVISGFLAVIASIINAYVGYCVVKETRMLREEENRPDIVLFLQEDPNKPYAKYLNIRNLGRRVAKNIRFKFLEDRIYLNHEPLSNLVIFREGISNLSPNEEKSFLIAILTPANFEDQTKNPFSILVLYEDTYGKQWSTTFSFNLKIYENLMKIKPT